MGLFNEHSSTQSDTASASGTQGPQGPQGVGFKLDADGNYDIQNKKLKNIQNGDADQDAMTKKQIESYVGNKTQYLNDINPGEVKSNKAVIYSNTGSIHSKSLYLKDQHGQEVIFHNEDQDDNQIRLYIPNLKNNDSYGGRLKSSIMVTSINQTIEGKKIFHNIEVPTPTIDGHASNMAYIDNEISKISDASDNSNYVKRDGDVMTGSLVVPKDSFPIQGDLNKVINYETTREIFLSKREGGQMQNPIDMNNHTIENLISPTVNDHACTKGYADNLVINKADSSDLNDYLKLDGSKSMAGNLNMDNNRIYKLPNPQLADEPTTLGYVTQLNNNLFNSYLDLKGTRKMEGNLNMNNNLIQNVKDPINENSGVNKKYVDDSISRSIIKPSHIPKNVFKYLMEDVNEWTTEYNIEVNSFIDLDEIPHSWNKRVLGITPIKDGKNYRFRLGIQMGPLITNQSYSIVVEMYNRDFVTWGRQETFIDGTGIWLKSHNTVKFQHHYGNNNTIYYSKTLIKFNKTSFSGSLTQIYFTIHLDDRGGDMGSYAEKFENQIYILAYGTLGDINNISPLVYDEHEAFEIDKTKLKMLVPLDLNNNSITNVKNPTNGKDAVNKNYADNLLSGRKNVSNIYVFGTINNDRYFISSSVRIFLNNVYVTNIVLHSKPKKIDFRDKIIIKYNIQESVIEFPFTQKTTSPSAVSIEINRFFRLIRSISTEHETNTPFILIYKVFY